MTDADRPDSAREQTSGGDPSPGGRNVLQLGPGIVVALAAAVVTAHGLIEVVIAARVPQQLAWLYPLITDGLAAVAYRATGRLAGGARRYAWGVVVLAAGVSGLAQAIWLAGNGMAEAPTGLRFGVGAWPAISAAVVAHLLYLLAEAGDSRRANTAESERDPDSAPAHRVQATEGADDVGVAVRHEAHRARRVPAIPPAPETPGQVVADRGRRTDAAQSAEVCGEPDTDVVTSDVVAQDAVVDAVDDEPPDDARAATTRTDDVDQEGTATALGDKAARDGMSHGEVGRDEDGDDLAYRSEPPTSDSDKRAAAVEDWKSFLRTHPDADAAQKKAFRATVASRYGYSSRWSYYRRGEAWDELEADGEVGSENGDGGGPAIDLDARRAARRTTPVRS